MTDKEAVYNQIIHKVFFDGFRKGATSVDFLRSDMEEAAIKLGLIRPRNLGDIPYAFRFRRPLPDEVRECAPGEQDWVIRIVGRGMYAFEPVKQAWFTPNKALAATKIPDATPALIERYALNDEQAVLAVLRYNRLIDIFTGVTCYSLQSHLRTTVEIPTRDGKVSKPQIETDEVYLGIDQRGAQHLIPVQAKGGTDTLGVVQVEQDFLLCKKPKFRDLIPLPIGAQFVGNERDRLIALFQFVQDPGTGEVSIGREKHYRLVSSDGVSDDDLSAYAKLPFD
jgi:hypothetical protein